MGKRIDSLNHRHDMVDRLRCIKLQRHRLLTCHFPPAHLHHQCLPPAHPLQVMAEFHRKNDLLISFVASVVILGSAFGSLLIAPLTEIHGRLYVYHISHVLFIGSTIACASSTSLTMLISFLASWPALPAPPPLPLELAPSLICSFLWNAAAPCLSGAWDRSLALSLAQSVAASLQRPKVGVPSSGSSPLQLVVQLSPPFSYFANPTALFSWLGKPPACASRPATRLSSRNMRWPTRSPGRHSSLAPLFAP